MREGCEIVVPGPTCSYMLKQEYPWLDGSEDAKLVAANTRTSSSTWRGFRPRASSTRASPNPVGAVTYHCPATCGRRTSAPSPPTSCARFPARRSTVVERCSAVDGTWGFKKEYFELSMKLAKPLFDAVADGAGHASRPIARWPRCRSARAPGRTPQHPVQVLAAAYGLDEIE